VASLGAVGLASGASLSTASSVGPYATPTRGPPALADVPPIPLTPSTYSPDPAAALGPAKDAPLPGPPPAPPAAPLPDPTTQQTDETVPGTVPGPILTPVPAPGPVPLPPPPVAVPPPPVVRGACSTTLAGTQAHVARAGNSIRIATGFTGPVQGRSARTGVSDHPSGLALDFIVGLGNTALGDRIAAYALAHQAELGVTYVIWRQRFNDGSGFVPMADRGSATANHLDHVHISLSATPPPVAPTC